MGFRTVHPTSVTLGLIVPHINLKVLDEAAYE